MLDWLKNSGFHRAAKAGLSIGVDDMIVAWRKEHITAKCKIRGMLDNIIAIGEASEEPFDQFMQKKGRITLLSYI
jgi:hypothetical protein